MQKVTRATSIGRDPTGQPKSAVQVQFSECDYNRKTDSELERLIELTWEARHQENPRIFNGSKFRLAKLEECVGPQTGDMQRMTSYCLHMGLTNYRDFLGTNCCDRVDQWQLRGQDLHQDRQAFMSDALGVGALVITADDQVVFLLRSQVCSEARGLLDRPGGHAEPEMVMGINEVAKTIVEKNVLSDSIAEEIFDSILREVIDEVNIPRSALGQPRMYGIVENLTTGGRPSAEFLIRCSLTSLEICKLFHKGSQKEAEESIGIYFVDIGSITSLPAKNSSVKLEDFAPAAQGAMNLYADLVRLSELER